MGRYEEELGRYIHMMKSSVEVTKRWVFDDDDTCRYNVMSSIDVEQDVCEEEPDRYDVGQCRKDKEEGGYEEEPRGVVRIKDMKGFLAVMNSCSDVLYYKS
jgi:hypothetical protein